MTPMTIQELRRQGLIKEGDTLMCKEGTLFKVITSRHTGLLAVQRLKSSNCWSTTSTKFIVVEDEPKTWGEMSDCEKGALLLAHQRGETIQFSSSNNCWTKIIHPFWFDTYRYRVKPTPVIETLVKYSGGDQKGWNSCQFSSSKYKMTYNLVDGEIDCKSFKVEKI